METIQVNRCAHCMTDVPPGVDICPRCGKNPLEVDQPAYCLRPFSILRGKYLVGRMMGRGGFGITYIGWDLLLETKVAIKECCPGSLASRNNSVSSQLQWSTSSNQWRAACEGFLREARKMAKIRDIPEVVRVQDTFEENNTAYIIMDFVEGITLKEWLEQNGTLSPAQCVELLRPMIGALERIHRQGFIHRDISPDNIMLQSVGGMKLLDLGAAKELAQGENNHSQLVTKSGFSPIEQYTESGRIGPWTDVYAICATLYYCMTGRLMPSAPDRIDGGSPLLFPQGTLKGPMPVGLEAVLRDGLALGSQERIQSMAELLARLDRVEPALLKPRPEPKPWFGLRSKPKSKIIAAVAAAMLMLFVGGICLPKFLSPPLELELPSGPTISVFGNHTVGLKSDGTVTAVGYNEYGQCDVDGWADIVAVAAGGSHTVGLKSNGTVVATGGNGVGQCDVADWSNIVAVAAGAGHTVGLKSDGTVIAAGRNEEGQCDHLDDWVDIVAIACGGYHTVGLRSDGTVVAAGDNDNGQCNVDDWVDIISIACGSYHTIGLRSDGTVVAVGKNDNGQCNIGGWSDIVAVAPGPSHTVGLKSNGIVVAVGENYAGQCNVNEWSDIVAVACGYTYTVGLKSDGTVVAVGKNDYGQFDVGSWTDIALPNGQNQSKATLPSTEKKGSSAASLKLKLLSGPTISTGLYHTLGLKSDGTVVATGENEHGQCNVDDWTNIVAVAAGGLHTVGLRSNGTVVATGFNGAKQCNVIDWVNIVAVSGGDNHTIGLKSNGTVLAAGSNLDGQCNVGDWEDIVAVAAGSHHTVGLKSNGTVVATGRNEDGQCNVDDWTDIVAIAAGTYHTLGLKSDGTVVTVGNNEYGQCNVDGWTNIVMVAADFFHTVGLKSDGTVVAVGGNTFHQCDVDSWTDIKAIACGTYHTVGLKSDGTVVATNYNNYGQCNIDDWTNIALP